MKIKTKAITKTDLISTKTSQADAEIGVHVVSVKCAIIAAALERISRAVQQRGRTKTVYHPAMYRGKTNSQLPALQRSGDKHLLHSLNRCSFVESFISGTIARDMSIDVDILVNHCVTSNDSGICLKINNSVLTRQSVHFVSSCCGHID